MPKVIFKYNIEKDAWSWVCIAKSKNLWGLNWGEQLKFIPDNLLKKIVEKDRKTAELLACKYILSHPRKNLRKAVIKEDIVSLEKCWRKIEDRFFKRLEKITQRPIFTKNFTCYFTSGFMCPYNEEENWFMVSIWHSIPKNITTICHEILHLQFLYHYKKYCRKFLSRSQLETLKESLTFLLNTYFQDLTLSEDTGYPHHQKLRKKLKKVWEKKKDFKEFLRKSIKIIKKFEKW